MSSTGGGKTGFVIFPSHNHLLTDRIDFRQQKLEGDGTYVPESDSVSTILKGPEGNTVEDHHPNQILAPVPLPVSTRWTIAENQV